jgi:hypothetical protein
MSSALGQFWRASMVLLFVSILFVSFAALVRRPLATATSLAGLLLVFVALANWLGHPRFTPLRVIAQVMGIPQTPFGIRDARAWDLGGRPTDLIHLRPPSNLSPASVGLWLLVAATTVGLLDRLCARQRSLA